MLQKAPKILAFSSILFVVGVLAYTVNTRYADNSIKGVMFDSTSSPNSEKYPKKCCHFPPNIYLCALKCENGSKDVGFPGENQGIACNDQPGGNCMKPPPSSSSSDPQLRCCNLAGNYSCAVNCPQYSVSVPLGDGVECTTTGEDPTCKASESSSSPSSAAQVCCRDGMGTYCAGKCRPGAKSLSLDGLSCNSFSCNPDTGKTLCCNSVSTNRRYCSALPGKCDGIDQAVPLGEWPPGTPVQCNKDTCSIKSTFICCAGTSTHFCQEIKDNEELKCPDGRMEEPNPPVGPVRYLNRGSCQTYCDAFPPPKPPKNGTSAE